MTSPHDPSPSSSPLDALIASYLQEVESGQVPDRRAWLDRNPDHAEPLQAFFNDFDRMDRVAAPLRMAGDLDETAAVDITGLTKLPTVRYFGDYELLEEVARGGMGVVYKARQTSLNRLVALKMILAGTFATPREVVRFQAEAEAAANLDHPGIVPVYEVGEHDGQQYFSMKFIEGGSLASVPRDDIKVEVKGLIAIARAVHYAHQHGVLHRDLKPSNVLVDPRGDRHVTDFGLAKRLADVDRSLTEAGQILGTPRYMSPEQAAGRKDLTVAADVYALGVILYERLTGRTPFEGPSALELLRQVRETEPPRPSGLCPELDRDLETIVLKSLEKDPARRYPTAQELIEDLTRWLEGRPIAARPVGQGEKFVRWCRRNPVVAGLSASVALALVLGVVVSSLFAYQERKARIRAELAEDKTERAFARSLVRPLDLNGLGHIGYGDPIMGTSPVLFKPELSEPEVEALWELAKSGEVSLSDRFFEEAIRNSFTLRQLDARSEPALVAALGLDATRRDRAGRFLIERLRQPGLSVEAKVRLSFLILESDDGSSSRAEDASHVIIQALQENLRTDFRSKLEKKLIGTCDFMAPSRAAPLVVAALIRTKDDDVHTILIEKLMVISARLDPSAGNALCSQAARPLAEAIERDTNETSRRNWAQALTALSSRIEPIEAGHSARLVARAIQTEKEVFVCLSLTEALTALTARLDPAEAALICRPAARSVTQALEQGKKNKTEYYQYLFDALATLSSRLDSTEVTTTARLLTLELEPKKLDVNCIYAANALSTISSRLEPAEALTISRRIAQAIRPDFEYKSVLAQALATVSSRIPVSEAAALCGPVAQTIVEAIDREQSNSAQNDFAQALVALTGRLEAGQGTALCARASRSIVQVIEHKSEHPESEPPDYNPRYYLTSALESLSVRLNPAELAPIARSLARAIPQEKENNFIPYLAKTLATMAERLDPAEAALICEPVVRSLAQTIKQDPYDRVAPFEALASLLESVKPGEAASIARSLIPSIELERISYSRGGVFGCLELLATQLEPAELAPIARRLALAIHRNVDTNSIDSLISSLCVVLNRLEPAEALTIADLILRTLERTTDEDARSKLAKALSVLAQRFESTALIRETTTQICSSSIEIVNKWEWSPADSLRQLIAPRSASRSNEQAVRFMAAVLQAGPGGTLTATIREASEPSPCRLNSQELIDLLKMPTLIGDARRVILDELGTIHGRQFANHWEFVRFAQETGLKLDFTSPPRRPERPVSQDRSVEPLPK